ncbi:MAG: hypothetical protein HY784_16975 [Chloroflexi bacterium]|nr:hypothetical protein [Chloroflexota bacterium]
MNHWYALHTKPRMERVVASQLRLREVNVYLPLVRVNPVNPRAARERAYFPCYLFANVDLDQVPIRDFRWTPGMRRILEFGGETAIVPDHLIHELKRWLEEVRVAGGLTFHGLERGDRVRIVNGPFSGYEAIFDARLTGTDRVKVLLEMLEHARWREGRAIPLELNAGDIVRIKRRGRRRH